MSPNAAGESLDESVQIQPGLTETYRSRPSDAGKQRKLRSIDLDLAARSGMEAKRVCVNCGLFDGNGKLNKS